jgi:hypothetical protein
MSKISPKESSQTLILVIFIVIIFASTIATISSIATKELELGEVQERALNAQYASETAQERAREVLSRGYALKFNGNSYIDVGQEKIPLFDNENGTYEQFTIEGWFKIDNLNFKDFRPIITRGEPGQNCQGAASSNKGCVEGSIAVAGDGFTITNPPPGGYRYCPKRLHIIIFFSTLLCNNCYYFVPITTDSNHACTPDGGVDEIKPGKWYHFIVNYVGNPTPTFYIYLNGMRITYYMAGYNAGIQGGNYNIRIGTTMKKDVYFNGVIDEVRIYKHPRYCGNPPTFWPNSEPGSPTDPNDPLNHYYGNYGYQDNIPPCNSSICGSSVCNVWRSDPQYYPPDYNMETHDLKLYYNFDDECLIKNNPSSGCVGDKSSSGDDNGTPYNVFLEIPAAPNYKNPVYVDVTQYGKVVTLDQDIGPAGDLLNEMSNGFTYYYWIVPVGKDKDGNSCDCASPSAGCCCSGEYCIFTFANSS